MKSLHQNICVAAATLSLTALAFSQLGTPPQGVTQPLAADPAGNVFTTLNEGYFVANGASYYTRNGQAFRVEREVSIRVTPNGIIGFDGQPLNLGAGIMLTPDGRHAPIPPGINLRALPGNANPFPAGPAEATQARAFGPQGSAPAVRETPELEVVPPRQR